MGKFSLVTTPAFLFSVFVFYWAYPFFAIIHAGTLLDFKGPRQDILLWGRMLRAFFRVKVLRVGTQKLYKPQRTILYLCNHRSWADFFLDALLSEGNASLMSRWLVFWVFPIFMTAVRVLKGVVLFKRGAIVDKKVFNEWLDSQLAISPLPGLLVYPEGHRNTLPQSLPLKRGMIHYAHSRGMPVQLIISRGKDAVLTEKTWVAQWGATVAVAYSAPIESKELSFEEFATKIQSTWDKLWTEVYSADLNSLPPLVQESTPSFDYPRDMRIKHAVLAYSSVAIAWAVILLSIKLLVAATACLGFLGQQLLFIVLVSLLIRSLSACQLTS